MNIQKNLKINTKLLPIKAHYFFLCAALGGVLPYLPVVAKQLGISASAVGITFSLIPFCSFVSRPLIGLLVDYFRRIKVFLIGLVILATLCLFSVLLLPKIKTEPQENIRIQVKFSNSMVILPFKFKKTCLESIEIKNINCTLKTIAKPPSINGDTLCMIKFKIESFEKIIHFPNDTDSELQTFTDNTSFLILNPENTFKFDETCNIYPDNISLECQPSFQDCMLHKNLSPSSVYSSYQFWIFTLLAIVSGAAVSSSYSLSDVGCYEILGDQAEHYGRQLLWGTMSWGIICPLSGFVGDLVSKNSEEKDFSPGFYFMLAFTVIDIITLMKLSMAKTKFSANMFKDIKSILSSGEIIVFAIGVYIVGSLTSIIVIYEFWYLEDMGASHTLLGLTIAFQCLIGEMPFLFFSGWFIRKFGHFLCLAFSFVGFALRLGFYSAIRNPWLALPVDILHGLTFAMFYSTMTSFASQRGPSGMEATMLGTLGGLYEGLGPCTGSFLGGIGLDKIGGRSTFLVASIIGLMCVPVFAIAPRIMDKIASCRKVKKNSPIEMLEKPVEMAKWKQNEIL